MWLSRISAFELFYELFCLRERGLKVACPLRRERDQERLREIVCATIFYINALPLKRELERKRDRERIHKTLALAFPLAGFGLEIEL